MVFLLMVFCSFCISSKDVIQGKTGKKKRISFFIHSHRWDSSKVEYGAKKDEEVKGRKNIANHWFFFALLVLVYFMLNIEANIRCCDLDFLLTTLLSLIVLFISFLFFFFSPLPTHMESAPAQILFFSRNFLSSS